MPATSTTAGSASNCSNAISGHKLVRGSPSCSTGNKYGSVKYNRLPNTKDTKEEVHECHSNPITASETPAAAGQGSDFKPPTKSSALATSPELASGGNITPRKMSMLEAPQNVPYVNRKTNTVPRNKQLVLSPPSLHISFDVEPENSQLQQIAGVMPMSQSSDNVRHFHPRYDSVGSSCSSTTGRTYSPSRLRRYRRNQHKRLLDQTEIAQISAGYMRVNGVVQQFKGILSAPEKSPSLLTKVLQKEHSKEKEKEKERDKEDSSTTTLITAGQKFHNNNNNNNSTNIPSVFSSVEDVKSTAGLQMDTDYLKPVITAPPSRPPSRTPSNAAAAAEATVEMLRSQTRRLDYRLFTLGYRQTLFDRRRKACDYSCVFAVLGIIMMIVENEMTAAGVYTKDSSYSYCLKSLIVLSTLILLMFILLYHAIEIQLFMADLGCRDWRILMNTKRLVQITAELLACIICPIPGNFHFTWHTVHHDGKTVTAASVPVDVLLSIPMFLRLYLLCRLMLLHSKLFTDAPSRSIGAMNRVNFTSRFILKTLMTMSPGTVLLTATMSWWLMAAWIMLLCERYHGYPYYKWSNDDGQGGNKTVMNYEAIKHQNYLNSLWLVAITSLTIGYGDIVPNTYCGRTVSVICGIMGAGTSSFVVAVVARKLELSRAEKHVHNFMMDTLLTKKLKYAAANVLRETWLIYRNKKLGDKADASRIRCHQRKFLLAIYELRKVKRGQRKLSETSTTVADMAKTTSMMYEIISDMRTWQQDIEDRVVTMDQRCANVEAYMRQLQISIRALPEVVARKLQRPGATAPFVAASSYETSSQPASGVQSSEHGPNGSGFSSPE